MSEKTYFLPESAIEAIKAKAREDAIDEMLSYYNTNYSKVKEMENGKEPWSYWKNIIDRLKQMKEQSDGGNRES